MTTSREPALARRAIAEATGTALLVCGVVGSGIAAQRLSPGQVGLQLLENALATAAILVALLVAFRPISGAHLNPVVTMIDRAQGRRTNREATVYAIAQIAGGCVGALVANAMFDLPLVEIATQHRSSTGLWLGEVVATFGLVVVIFTSAGGTNDGCVPFAVAGYIAGAYWFTSSTSFANPAVTISRTLSDTFAGIAPVDVPPFIAAQLVGALLGLGLLVVLKPLRTGGWADSSITATTGRSRGHDG